MRQVRIFTCPYSSNLGNFDDRVFQDFIKDKQLLDIQSQYFVYEQTPCWTLVVQYRLDTAQPTTTGSADKLIKEDFRELLTESERPLFDTLRTWRAERAKADGVPPYVICTNRQLSEIVTKRPESLNQLALIEGFGASKIEKYGAEIIAFLTVETSEPHA